MNKPSELERFLRSQSTEGRVESRGAFTISRQEALAKLGEFALPFSGAWAVKVVQGLVASGSEFPIRVDLSATEIHFFFLRPDFSLDEFEERFYTPEPSKRRSLRHLLSGLWNVALREKWGFQLALMDCSTTLIWDGHQLHRVESPRKRDCACLAVAPLQQKKNLSWVAGIAMAGSRNAELLLTLAQRCYLCPVPLTVDGRRLDSLQRSPHNGWGEQTFPFTLGFAEADLPSLRIPPGTFLGVPVPLHSTSPDLVLEEGGGWKRSAEARMKDLKFCKESPLSFLLCANMRKESKSGSDYWTETRGPSMISWVLDGVVIEEERLFERARHISVGCFVSAEGLDTDLTTLSLLDTEEKRRRFANAKVHLRSALKLLEDEKYEKIVRAGNSVPKMVGGLMMLAGAGFLWVAPVIGAGLAIVGGRQWGKAALGGGERARQVRLGLTELIYSLSSGKAARGQRGPD